MRSNEGFELNFELGRKIIESELTHCISFYLPPEFMLTGQQIHVLVKMGVRGTFLNPQRFSEDVQRRLPQKPYLVRGVLGTYLNCIPCDGKLTNAYLKALYRFEASEWNLKLRDHPLDTVYSWRDGESCFLVPDGLEREAAWLKNESEGIARRFVPDHSDFDLVQTTSEIDAEGYRSYPVHSFSEWMKEFRMMGYIQKLQDLEKSLKNLTAEQWAVWLSAIGSDVLSAVEKRDRLIELFSEKQNKCSEYRIIRCDRGFEGEDCLTILENLIQGNRPPYLKTSQAPHMKKLRARITCLERLLKS